MSKNLFDLLKEIIKTDEPEPVNKPVSENYRKVYTSDSIYLNSCANCKTKCGRLKTEKFICNNHQKRKSA